ncbi:haloacid dehalogenase type II [Streptomyces sp. NPDC001793]|uniref:haloacid dehalogenase type II n=1 Tax=Streptomyces sp. NPDC001793 TaxID=3154657 RepID=UPI00332D4E4B
MPSENVIGRAEDALVPQIRVIFFDTFGTVVDWRSSMLDTASRLGRHRGVDADWGALVDAWRAEYAPSMDRVRRGELPWTTLDDLHRSSLRKVITQLAIDGLTTDDLEVLVLGWHQLHPWPDVLAGLHRLKGRYTISTLSNGSVAMLTDIAKNTGLPWDHIIGADVFHHYKPDREVYLGACSLLGCAPEEAVMCAAHNDDLAHARSAGLGTAFLRRPTEHGPRQQTDLYAQQEWDYTADSITELARLLDRC